MENSPMEIERGPTHNHDIARNKMIGILLLSILIPLVVWAVLTVHKKRQYFNERNVKHVKPNFFFGNTFEVLMGWKHQSEKLDELYRGFPGEELFGYYDLLGAQVIIRSPELADAILVKNFSNFHDRVVQLSKIDSPEDANVFTLAGNTWRAVRMKFSPLFTSGKLKFMYHSIADCGKTLVSVLEEKEGQDVEMSEIMGLFATDVIGSTAFGIEANLLRNPKSQFRVMAKKIFSGSFFSNIRIIIFFFFPKFSKLLGIKGFFSGKEVGNYFFGIIRNTLRERKEKGLERNDFVQMLLQLKQKGKIEVQIHDSGDDYLFQENTNETFELEITDDLLVGGAFTFFVAGFHATAMTLTYTLYELSQYPEVEAKLREEIESLVQGEEPSYEELRKMSYLENVIKEAMRLHPVANIISRICTKEFTSPGGFVFKPGQLLSIPVQSIQTDPAYWPDPQIFNPDRFQKDCPPKPGTYLPFGSGPRICIALRFAMLEMKYALVKLMMNYKFELSEKTKLPLQIDKRSFLISPADGIYYRVRKIK